MLLHELKKIANLGAEKPLVFWINEYDRIKINILPQAQLLLNKLHNTKAQKLWKTLITVFNKAEPVELDLAESLSSISILLQRHHSEHDSLSPIELYTDSSEKFLELAKRTHIFSIRREKIKAKLSEKEQRAADLKLFQEGGMYYCLEYYLMIYKKLIDAKSTDEQKMYIEAVEFNLGTGSVAGLWFDFYQFEVLEEFIYLILDDDLRDCVTEAYFNTRSAFMKVKRIPNADGTFTFDYSQISINGLIGHLRQFTLNLMEAFLATGVEQLSSYFYAPYGHKPYIREIIL